MKKSLFAIAAVTAFAGAAQAQSSVTVYGIIDTGYAGGNAKASSAAGNPQGTFSMLQMSGGESSNRLGFRGVEDLGSGLSAKFVLESSLQANTDAWTPTWRQAWAGFAKKGLGEARIGTQNSLIWQLAAPMTVGQLNNFNGSVINATNFQANSNTGSTTAASNDGNVGFTNRSQRTLQLESERMSGVQAKAMYVLNNANTNETAPAGSAQTGSSTGGMNNFNGWGLSLDFTGVKNLRVAGAYQSFNSDNPYTASSLTNANGAGTFTAGTPAVCPGNAQVNTNAFTGATTQCQNVRDNQYFLAATYDFGILTAYVNYINRKATSVPQPNVYVSRSAQEIGVRSFITPTIEGWASAGNGRYTSFGSGQPTANIVGYQVGANYWMSKRTNLYAIYGATGTSNASNTANASDSSNVNNYGLGVRHTF
jgi:predicted porin